MFRKLITALLALVLVVPIWGQGGRLTVRGRVTDSEGEALEAITVYEDGRLSNGTVTDANGRYSITVPKGAVLVFSSLGYVDARNRRHHDAGRPRGP